jgi:hypothetical protein
MNPHLALSFIIVLCIMLVITVYILGVEVGKTNALLKHPGYGVVLQA